MKPLDIAPSACKFDELCSRLTDPSTDSISQTDLWDISSIEQLELHLEDLDSQLAEQEKKLKDAIVPHKLNYTSEKYCELHPGDDDCETENLQDRYNFDTVSTRLRNYKETQKKQTHLYNYHQRRCIKERMEGLFGVKGYLNLERFIFALIIAVLAVLAIEFAYFDDLFFTKETENYYIVRKIGDWLPLSLFYIAMFDLFAGCVFLTEYFLRLHYSENKAWYIKNHKIDLISSIPLTGIIVLLGIPKVSPDFMFLRILRLLRIFRAMRIASFFWRGMERLEQVADVKMMRKSLALMITLTLLGTILITMLESNFEPIQNTAQTSTQVGIPNTVKNIKEIDKNLLVENEPTIQTEQIEKTVETSFLANLFDQLRPTLTTLTAGELGEHYNPESSGGWAVGIFLIVSGIVVVGIFTATLTSIFRGEDTNALLSLQQKTHDSVKNLPETLNKLNSSLKHSEETINQMQIEIDDLRNKNRALETQLHLYQEQLSHEHT